MEIILVCIIIVVFFYLRKKANNEKKRLLELRLQRERDEQDRQEEEHNRREVSKIIKFHKGDYVKGYDIKSEIAWVRVSGCDNIEKTEFQLKLQAAEKGANALIKMHWVAEKERYVAGYGNRGNPYYQSKTIYNGEALAVIIKEKIRSKNQNRLPITESSAPRNTRKELEQGNSQNTSKFSHQKNENAGSTYTAFSEDKTDLKKPMLFSGDLLVIDGNNIFGEAENFEIIKNFINKIEKSKYNYVVFWDYNFNWFLLKQELKSKDEKLNDFLARNLAIDKSKISVSPSGTSSDDFLIKYALQKNAAVISNDGFKKEKEDFLILDDATKLRQEGRLMKFSVILDEIIVPQLNFDEK